MTLPTDEEMDEIEDWLNGEIEEDARESTPPASPPKESLNVDARELEAAAEVTTKTETQKTLAGEIADKNKLKNGKKQKSEEDLELEWLILERLGFAKWDDSVEGKGLKYKLKLPTSILDEPAKYPKVWITRKYSDEQPNGRFSAVPINEDGKIVMRGEKPAFLAKEDCEKLPPIANFYKCREAGYVPPKTVIGRLVRTEGGSRCVEIDSNQGEVTGRRISYPETIIHKNANGDYFIPANLNVADNKGRKRMNIPRELVIEDYKNDEKQLQVEESERQRTKKKEEPPEYVPDDLTGREHDKDNSDEKEVTTTKDSDTGEDAYMQQAKKQAHSIRETFEICYDEARAFVKEKIAPALEARLKQEGEFITFEKEMAIFSILEDYTLRIAQGFSITHQQNQRSGRY